MQARDRDEPRTSGPDHESKPSSRDGLGLSSSHESPVERVLPGPSSHGESSLNLKFAGEAQASSH